MFENWRTNNLKFPNWLLLAALTITSSAMPAAADHVNPLDTLLNRDEYRDVASSIILLSSIPEQGSTFTAYVREKFEDLRNLQKIRALWILRMISWHCFRHESACPYTSELIDWAYDQATDPYARPEIQNASAELVASLLYFQCDGFKEFRRTLRAKIRPEQRPRRFGSHKNVASNIYAILLLNELQSDFGGQLQGELDRFTEPFDNQALDSTLVEGLQPTLELLARLSFDMKIEPQSQGFAALNVLEQANQRNSEYEALPRDLMERAINVFNRTRSEHQSLRQKEIDEGRIFLGMPSVESLPSLPPCGGHFTD